MFSSNVVFEEFVLRSLKVSPLIKPLLENICLFEVLRTSRVDSFFKSFALVYACVKESDLDV